jgi:uncharacterized protein YabN with tetrapyrrole methylase and pyrophosphatase domain
MSTPAPDLGPLFSQIARLRAPQGGCPWDKEQTLPKTAKSVRGEAEELAEALAAGDGDGIREEAGDLIWNLCFVLHLAFEQGICTPEEVLAEVIEKMTRRHPHVFGDLKAETPEEALAAFKAAKAKEKNGG